MTAEQSFVIVGAGLAGAKAVQTLRSEGFGGRIHLVGDDSERPYERPPLSKGYLNGSQPRESIFVHEEGWYAEHQVELRLDTSACGLDLTEHELVLEGGERIRFDKLLLATGAAARRLDVPGADLDGVRYLRRASDADILVAGLAGGGRKVAVIGGGWIGLEVAAAARGYGNDVTVVEPQPSVLLAVLGAELGGMFADLHREHGVRLLLGDGVRSLQGSAQGVSSVVTTAGVQLPADLVVVGVGARPNTQLAESAGLRVDNGIVVDQSLRSSHPDVFAAGDVANAFHPLFGRHLRVEHWANALNQGPAVARSMLGQSVSYERIPYFYTDQYDLGMEYSGAIGPDGFDGVVYRGDRDARTFIAFWLKAGRVLAGMNVNVWDVTDPIQALIRSGVTVDIGRLADPDQPLDAVD
jgi:3-phenylpropionate/trans-cinnamate dioxygenase ferredoxin reductase component